MTVRFKKQFSKDIDKLPSASLRLEVAAVIEAAKKAASMGEMTNVKKLQGCKTAYRIRVGAYRVGVVVQAGELFFVRVLHRREIYRLFP